MTAPKLSAVVVGQDNARTLGRVLDQLCRVADEVVVVDGGSSDDSLAIASRRDGVRLIEHAFPGSIAAQKNFAFDQAGGEWILVLDTDELLSPRAVSLLPRLIRVPFASWFKLSRCWLVEAGGRPGFLDAKPHFPDWQLRLFRNRPPFRYDLSRSPVHHNFPKEGRGFGRKLRRASILHYDFLLNDRAAREAKQKRYLELDPASAQTHRMYLWEDFDLHFNPAVPGPAAAHLHR